MSKSQRAPLVEGEAEGLHAPDHGEAVDVAVRAPGDDTTRRVRAREASQPVRVVAPFDLDGRVLALDTPVRSARSPRENPILDRLWRTASPNSLRTSGRRAQNRSPWRKFKS